MSDRLKVFNTFVKELHSKLPESSKEIFILKNTQELNSFEKKYTKKEIIEKSISFPFLNTRNFIVFWTYFPSLFIEFLRTYPV